MPTFRLRIRNVVTYAREATADVEAATLTEAMDQALAAARSGDLAFEQEQIDSGPHDVALVGTVLAKK